MQRWVITYDVSVRTRDGRRRAQRIRRLCNEYGDRLQKSVYLIRGQAKVVSELKSKADRVINQDEDHLRIFEIKGFPDGELEPQALGVII